MLRLILDKLSDPMAWLDWDGIHLAPLVMHSNIIEDLVQTYLAKSIGKGTRCCLAKQVTEFTMRKFLNGTHGSL